MPMGRPVATSTWTNGISSPGRGSRRTPARGTRRTPPASSAGRGSSARQRRVEGDREQGHVLAAQRGRAGRARPSSVTGPGVNGGSVRASGRGSSARGLDPARRVRGAASSIDGIMGAAHPRRRSVPVAVRRPRRHVPRGVVRALPALGDAHRRPPLRRPLAGHERGRARRPDSRSSTLGGRARRPGRRDPDRRRAHRPRPRPGRARRAAVRRGRAARDDLEPDGLGLHPGRRAPPAARRASSRRSPSGSRRSPAGSRGSRRSSRTRRPRWAPPDRPVSRLHAEMAAKRIGGVAELGRDAVRAGRGGGDRPVTRMSRRSCRASVPRRQRPAAALEAIGAHLATAVVPAIGGRRSSSGRALFAAKLRHTLRDPEATPEAMLARRGARVRRGPRRDGPHRATETGPELRPASRARRRGGLVRRRPGRDRDASTRPRTSSSTCASAELARIEAFCREHDVIGARRRAAGHRLDAGVPARFGGAMLDSPGRSTRARRRSSRSRRCTRSGRRTQVESYLREKNDRQLQLLDDPRGGSRPLPPGRLCEPGALARASVFRSGVFAEGWAVYVTQVHDGPRVSRGDDRALWLVHWKFYLRSVDQRDHRRPDPHAGHDHRGARSGSWSRAPSRRRRRRSPRTSAPGCRRPSCRRTSWARAGCGTSRTRRVDGRRWRPAPDATRCPTPRVVGGYGETPRVSLPGPSRGGAGPWDAAAPAAAACRPERRSLLRVLSRRLGRRASGSRPRERSRRGRMSSGSSRRRRLAHPCRAGAADPGSSRPCAGPAAGVGAGLAPRPDAAPPRAPVGVPPSAVSRSSTR